MKIHTLFFELAILLINGQTNGSENSMSHRSGRDNSGINKNNHSHSDIGRALLIPVLGSQPADDMSHKPGGRLPLHSARPAVTLAILQRPDTNFGV